MRDRVLFLILLFSLFPGRGTGEALNDAAAAQRQAIAELIQSLKSARRILSTRPPDPGSGTSGVKPVFRDRQTFLLPEMPPSANPAEQLNARIEEQKRLLDEMRRTPGSDAAAREKLMRQQREIREKTPNKTGSPLPRETARHLERAENAMKESENMLRSGRSSMAQTAAQKALADLKRAAGEIDVNGDRKMQRSLSAAQREMERLADRSGKGSSTPAQQEALRALAERLLADALNQHRTGKQSHAETLAELAKQIHDAATSTPAASLADLTARIRALRMEGRNARLVLEERLTALEELSQQLRYIAGHPETLDAPARTLLHDDLQTELELTELALEQLKLAEAIRQQKENTHNKPEIYNEYEKERLRKKELGDRDFVEYFRRTAGKRSGSNHNNWMSALTYLEQFTGGRVKFADLSEQYLEEFKEYLLTTQSVKSKRKKEPLSQNSALSYFNKVKATLKQAYKEGILQTDLNARVDSIKAAETRREYLTSEELNKLAKTPCKDDLLKRAALFSGLTGLRFSDIEKLTWGEIGQDESKGYTINFQQKKTKGIETMPISEQAFSLLGEQQKPESRIFGGLRSASYHSKDLRDWLKAAGITKHITFHCFRHTFATLQMFLGTDIFTVSKMLGHREIKTTQIYTKIVDEAKRQAANRIKLDL